MTCGGHNHCSCTGCQGKPATLGSIVWDQRHGFAQRRPYAADPGLACSGRYKALIVTGHGATMDDPCPTTGPDYCNDVDVKQWVNLSIELKARVRTAWNETAEAGYQIPKAVVDYVTAVDKEYCDADENWQCVTFHLQPDHRTWNPLNVGENSAAIGKIVKWCGRAVCALELLDNVRGQVSPIEPQPTPPPGPFPNFPQLPLPSAGSLVWIGVAVAVLWFISRQRASA